MSAADPMHPLWWALVGGAAVLLLLLLAALLWLARRHFAHPREPAALRSNAASASWRGSRKGDRLTGLPARADFEGLLEHAAIGCDHGGSPVAVLHIALDNFAAVNESYGQRVGDALLRETAQRLKAFADAPQSVCRLGGDEFLLLVKTRHRSGTDAAAQLLAMLQGPYEAESLGLRITASIGIALYPDHGARPRLLAHAALAMRTVKLGGGAGYSLFDPALGVDVREQADMLQDLRQAITRGELQLYYQPKVDARSLQVSACEALLRWQHPHRGMVSPALFIPLAERHGLIADIGSWVLEEACRQAAQWRQQGLRMRLAVNISGHQLRQDRLVAQIENMLRKHGVAPGRMTCEIAETVAMEDTLLTRVAIENLRRAGLQVSIDDFGTGQSSLAALRRLPVAEVKIDRRFVAELGQTATAAATLGGIVQMAHTLSMRVVAEGVETEAQRDALVALGCDEMQGYLFARPMSAPSLALWADNDRKSGDKLAFRASLFGATAPDTL